MCGIVGIIGSVNFDKDSVLSSISHRGPDNSGYFQEEKIFLGHSRLSIQDLSDRGNQPMFSADNRYCIIFNGEIYNHFDVRNKLSEFKFKSSGDTETVLYSYIKFGADCLELLNGIFSFAIFDLQTKDVFIARDNFGVKPLYIYYDNDLFLFSSEIKSFLSLPINKQIDKEALLNYLTFLWSPGIKTPFSKVQKLLPGHYLKFNINSIKNIEPVRYDFNFFKGEYFTDSEEFLINKLENLLIGAVEKQMLSDVPVGFFLSGGLDSTLLVAIARKMFPERKFHCFTIDVGGNEGSFDDFVDDLFYAKKAAELLNVDLHIVKSDINIVESFDKMIWYLDEPQADAAPLNVLKISKLARDLGIKVLIGGTGGDDIFSGYRRHQALLMEPYLFWVPRFLRKSLKFTASFFKTNSAINRRFKKVVENIDLNQNARLKRYFSWLPQDKVLALFAHDVRDELKSFNPFQYFDDLKKQIPQEKNLLNSLLYWELKTFLVDHNLNYTDKMGMAEGVEIRVPYLDKDLVYFSQLLPPQLKMKGKETKYILKKVAERYLPREIIYRPKTGFGAPVRKWITEDMSDLIASRLSKQNLENQNIFDSEKVWQLIEDNKNNKIDASYTIWCILAIDSWIKQFTSNSTFSNN